MSLHIVHRQKSMNMCLLSMHYDFNVLNLLIYVYTDVWCMALKEKPT